MANLLWFSDEQWTRIEPLLPRDTLGMPRVGGHAVARKPGGDQRSSKTDAQPPPTTGRWKLRWLTGPASNPSPKGPRASPSPRRSPLQPRSQGQIPATHRSRQTRQDRHHRRHAKAHRHRKYPAQSRQALGQITRLTITDTLDVEGLPAARSHSSIEGHQLTPIFVPQY